MYCSGFIWLTFQLYFLVFMEMRLDVLRILLYVIFCTLSRFYRYFQFCIFDETLSEEFSGSEFKQATGIMSKGKFLHWKDDDSLGFVRATVNLSDADINGSK